MYSILINPDLEYIAESLEFEIWYAIKVGTDNNFIDNQMRIILAQPQNPISIGHKRMECGIRQVNSETHSILVTSTYFEKRLRINSS